MKDFEGVFLLIQFDICTLINEKVLDFEQVFYTHYPLLRRDRLLFAKIVVVSVRRCTLCGEDSFLLLHACMHECYL